MARLVNGNLSYGCGFDGRVRHDAAASFAQFGGMTATSATACVSLRVGDETVSFESVYSVTSGESIQAAIDRAVADGAVPNNPALVLVGPGIYGAPKEPPRIRLSPGVHVAAANQGQSELDDLVTVTVPMYLDDPTTSGNPVVVSRLSVIPVGAPPAPQVATVWIRRGDAVLQNVRVAASVAPPGDSVQVGDASFVVSPGSLSLSVVDSNLEGGLTAFGWATVSIDPSRVDGILTSQAPSFAGANVFACSESTFAQISFTGAFQATFKTCVFVGSASFDGSGFSTSSLLSNLTLDDVTLSGNLTLVGPGTQTGVAVQIWTTRSTSTTSTLSCTGGVSFQAENSVLPSVASFTQVPWPSIPAQTILTARMRRVDYLPRSGSQLTFANGTYIHVQGSLAGSCVFSGNVDVSLESVVGNTATFTDANNVSIQSATLGSVLLSNSVPGVGIASLSRVQLGGLATYNLDATNTFVSASQSALNSTRLVGAPGNFAGCTFGTVGRTLAQSGLVLRSGEFHFDHCQMFNLELQGSDPSQQTISHVSQCVVYDSGSPTHSGRPIKIGTTGGGMGTVLWLANNTLVPSLAAGGNWIEDSTATLATDTVYGAGQSVGSFPPAGSIGNVLAAASAPVNPTNVTVVPLYFV